MEAGRKARATFSEALTSLSLNGSTCSVGSGLQLQLCYQNTTGKYDSSSQTWRLFPPIVPVSCEVTLIIDYCTTRQSRHTETLILGYSSAFFPGVPEVTGSSSRNSDKSVQLPFAIGEVPPLVRDVPMRLWLPWLPSSQSRHRTHGVATKSCSCRSS